MTHYKGVMADTSFLSHPAVYLIPLAYIIGSIPFGVLIVRQRGIDLQAVGSKNIGATNVLRTAGKGAAVATLVGDSLKGAVAVMLGRLMTGSEIWEGALGIAAVLGHLYPIFLSFKGGKGVATSFGVLVPYSPFSALIALIVWIITALLTRYSSLAAIMACISLPVIFALLGASKIKISFAIVLAFLIILRHKSNIKRLIEGSENRIGEKVKP